MLEIIAIAVKSVKLFMIHYTRYRRDGTAFSFPDAGPHPPAGEGISHLDGNFVVFPLED